MDLRWTSLGGTLLDGNGDIAMGTPAESLSDMIRTRLKADLNGWKLYTIGADLANRVGSTIDSELQSSITRSVESVLQNQLLRPGTFTVKTVPMGGLIKIYVYVQQNLVTTVQVSKDGTLQVSPN
jgi:hypothetical protein